jgi:DNA-binding beta-propeller fold protein YncE
VTALSLAGLVLLLATAAALAVTGDLTQPAGTDGCISEDGAGPCADGHALELVEGVAVSPDGKSVYVTSSPGTSGAVARLDRDTTTGAITQPAGTAGCVSETGAGPCADGHGLKGAHGVAVSPDGKSVYVASGGSDAVARLNRNTTTGAITQPAGTAGCVSETGTGGTCADGHGLKGPQGVAVSPDGKSVYVASGGSEAVARLNRGTTAGGIAQPAGAAGCVSETGAGPCADGHGLKGAGGVAVSPDGKSVYVASGNGKAVARLNRNTTTGAIAQPAGLTGCISEAGAGPCADGHGLNGPAAVAVSPDGKSVYVASTVSTISGAVARLNRNTTTGAITQPAGTAGCISETGTGGTCADGHALKGAQGVAVSPDGKSVYVAAGGSMAVARLNRGTFAGGITQPAGTAGCVSESGVGGCAAGHGLDYPVGVAVSPDGTSVYVAAGVNVEGNVSTVARFIRAP